MRTKNDIWPHGGLHYRPWAPTAPPCMLAIAFADTSKSSDREALIQATSFEGSSWKVLMIRLVKVYKYIWNVLYENPEIKGLNVCSTLWQDFVARWTSFDYSFQMDIQCGFAHKNPLLLSNVNNLTRFVWWTIFFFSSYNPNMHNNNTINMATVW